MRKTNFMRSLKRRALPLLTSVAMAISMLSGTGVTAMADNNPTVDAHIHFWAGEDPFDEFVNSFGADNNNDKNVPVTAGMLNNKLPSLEEAFDISTGYTFKWVEVVPNNNNNYNETGYVYDPSVNTYGDVIPTSRYNNATVYLKAEVVADKISVKLDADGGSWTGSQTTSFNKEYGTNLGSEIKDPIKEGYDFAGWDINGKTTIAKRATKDIQSSAIDTYATWNGHQGTANLKALWTKNNDTLTNQYNLAVEQADIAKGKVGDAEKAAAAAKEAAAAADKAAKAANDNPTADTAAAARKAAETAKTAAENATKAYSDAEAEYKAANEAYENLATDYAAANGNGAYIDPDLTQNMPVLAGILNDLEKNLGAARTETTKQAAAANKAAENALAAAAEADKNDGSEPGKLAPVESKLKDANGEYTGYVVTNADPSNPEVEYVATDADKKAKKISLPEKVKDRSGNEYNVTSIAAKALERADVKEIIIPKSVKKIGDKAFYKSKAKKITIKTTKKGKIKIGDKAFRVKPDKAKIRVKGAKGKYKDKIVKHVKKNAKKTADVK